MKIQVRNEVASVDVAFTDSEAVVSLRFVTISDHEAIVQVPRAVLEEMIHRYRTLLAENTPISESARQEKQIDVADQATFHRRATSRIRALVNS